MVPLPNFADLVQQFDGMPIKAIALMGSFARGDEGSFSDVDLVRFTGSGPAGLPSDGSTILDGRLVVVSTVDNEQVERWFNEPDQAVKFIAGVRQARPLVDRDGLFAAVQSRAQAFHWDADMQQKANVYASREMVGLIEEVHKGLQGLQFNDTGRLLNARFGLTWTLARILLVQRGILVKGDNSFFDQLLCDLGEASEWARLSRAAYAIAPLEPGLTGLPDQVRAGMHLYALTARMLENAFQPGDSELVRQTVARIESNLE